MTMRTIRSTGCCRTRWPCRSSPAATWACVDGVCTRCSPTPATTRSPPSTGADPKGAPWTPEPNREASQVGLGVIEERICALARYYAELSIEPPSKVEAKPQDFETQVREVIDAGVPTRGRRIRAARTRIVQDDLLVRSPNGFELTLRGRKI